MRSTTQSLYHLLHVHHIPENVKTRAFGTWRGGAPRVKGISGAYATDRREKRKMGGSRKHNKERNNPDFSGPVLLQERCERLVRVRKALNMGVVRNAATADSPIYEDSNRFVSTPSPETSRDLQDGDENREDLDPGEDLQRNEGSVEDLWIGSHSYQVIGGVVIFIMALVLLAAVSYQCAATWRWIRASISRGEAQLSSSSTAITKQASIRISHSLPDLQTVPAKQEFVQEKECKKVLRQTTLPTVPVRHQTFQRRLSHRLDVPCIQFSICRFEDRSDSSLGLIKPELYRSERERANSTDSNATVELEYCGKLHLALRYDQEIEGLVVKVLEARDLPVKDITGSSDPYIKVYLLPDRKKKFQTKVHRRNLNPVFNETFIFSVNYEDLHRRYLQFSVYDFDRFSRHDLIGQVVLKGLLDTTDLHQEIEYTMNILCPPQEKKHLGELMLSLCYLPRAGRLTLTVIKARNLKAKDINGKSDPYVKVYLLCEGKRIKKKKTTVKKSTLCPVYNEALVFDVPSENIEDVCLIVKVIDYDIIGANELLGCTGIGNNFIGIGRDHWLEMLDNPRKPVAQWYPLLESIPGHIPYASDNLLLSLSCLNAR